MPAFWVLTTVVVLSSVPCRGEPQLPAVPESADWTAGPATARLGEIAEIKIPSGYRFMGAEGARARLAQTENSIPKGLLGLLASDTGNWTMLFDFRDFGHLKDASLAQVNAESVLKTLSNQFKEQHPADAKASLSWQLEPRYDAAAHALESAVGVTNPKSNTETTFNYSVDFLGRHGVLHATVIYRGFTDLDTLKQLAGSVSFIEGQRYEDYQKNDKVSSLDLAGLITFDANSEVVPSFSARLKANAVWIGIGLAALVVAGGGGILLAGLLRRRQPQQQRRMERAPISASAPVAAAPALVSVAAGAPSQAIATAPATGAAGSPAFKPKAQPSLIQPKVSLSPKTTLQRRSASERRKMFDYNRYFSDLMSTVSHYATASPENQHSNGSSTVLSKAPSVSPTPTNGNGHSTNGVFHANSDLIAHQTVFIEEQRRLMQEQSRLIEEKSKLIAEKNQLLKLQSEYIEQKLL